MSKWMLMTWFLLAPVALAISDRRHAEGEPSVPAGRPGFLEQFRSGQFRMTKEGLRFIEDGQRTVKVWYEGTVERHRGTGTLIPEQGTWFIEKNGEVRALEDGEIVKSWELGFPGEVPFKMVKMATGFQAIPLDEIPGGACGNDRCLACEKARRNRQARNGASNQ